MTDLVGNPVCPKCLTAHPVTLDCNTAPLLTDLVERLRLADCKLDGRKLEDYADKLCKEAAAEITRLTAALEKSDHNIKVLDLAAMDAQRILLEETVTLRATLEKAEAKNAVAEKMAGIIKEAHEYLVHGGYLGQDAGLIWQTEQVWEEWKGLTDDS